MVGMPFLTRLEALFKLFVGKIDALGHGKSEEA
jgi:hypothetical protein